MNSSIRQEIGRKGEKLVSDFFGSKGFTVKRSEDPFDNEKDLKINGASAEVKTQTVYRNFPYLNSYVSAFTVPIIEDTKIAMNQLNKCMNVKYLIFVSRSSELDPYVRIYCAPSLGKRHFTIIRNKVDGRYVAGFIIDHMSHLETFTDKKIVDEFMVK